MAGLETGGRSGRIVGAILLIAASVGAESMAAEVGSLKGYVYAGAEVVAFGAGMLLFLSWLRLRLDELDERIRLEAYRWAFLLSALGLYGYGVFVGAGAPVVSLRKLALGMFFLFALSAGLIRRRYA